MGLSINRFPAALALILLLGGATAWAQRIETDFDGGVDFSRLKTFAWDPNNPLPPSFTEVDANRIDTAIRDSVERALKDKGFFQLMREADFMVSFAVTGRSSDQPAQSEAEAPVAAADSWNPFSGGSGEVDVSQEGALVLNVLDGATGRVLWQARSGSIVEPGKKLERRIDGGVKKMLKDFPPK